MIRQNQWKPDEIIVREQVQDDPATIKRGSPLLAGVGPIYNEEKFPT